MWMAISTRRNIWGSQQGAQHPWKTRLRNSRLGTHTLTVLRIGGCFEKTSTPRKPREYGQNAHWKPQMLSGLCHNQWPRSFTCSAERRRQQLLNKQPLRTLVLEEIKKKEKKKKILALVRRTSYHHQGRIIKFRNPNRFVISVPLHLSTLFHRSNNSDKMRRKLSGTCSVLQENQIIRIFLPEPTCGKQDIWNKSIFFYLKWVKVK